MPMARDLSGFAYFVGFMDRPKSLKSAVRDAAQEFASFGAKSI